MVPQALKDLNLNDKYFMSLLLPMEEVDFITCEVTSREDEDVKMVKLSGLQVESSDLPGNSASS